MRHTNNQSQNFNKRLIKVTLNIFTTLKISLSGRKQRISVLFGGPHLLSSV